MTSLSLSLSLSLSIPLIELIAALLVSPLLIEYKHTHITPQWWTGHSTSLFLYLSLLVNDLYARLSFAKWQLNYISMWCKPGSDTHTHTQAEKKIKGFDDHTILSYHNHYHHQPLYIYIYNDISLYASLLSLRNFHYKYVWCKFNWCDVLLLWLLYKKKE